MKDNTKFIIEQIVKFLNDYLKKTNTKGFVFGVSGGIDSALIGAIMSKYFPNNHLALTMNIYNSQKDIDDGMLVINHFNLNYKVIELEKVYDEFKKITPEHQMAQGNLKARMRMSTLYAYAQPVNYLVIGTSNAAEYLTGYFTKYGDSGSDIMPLVNLTKTNVYKCAQYLNVPSEIINKKPTAGLFENQTDEQDLKVSYKEIDNYLTNKKISKESKERIEFLKKVSLHKKQMPKSPLKKGRVFK